MHKIKKHKAIMILLALMLAIGVTVPSTLAYIQAETETVKNTFQPVKSVVHDLEISVTGEKSIQGREWQEGDSFIFMLQLWDAESESWVTVGTESAVYDKESQNYNQFDMSELVKEQLTEPRYYTFRVLEGQGSLSGMTYDTQISKFLLYVKADETGAMDIVSVTDKENTTVVQDSETGDFEVSMKFTNTYVKPEEPPVVPDPEGISFFIYIDKTVKNTGDETIGPGGFEFLLETKMMPAKFTFMNFQKSTMDRRELYTMPTNMK